MTAAVEKSTWGEGLPGPPREPLKLMAWKRAIMAVSEAVEHSNADTLAAIAAAPSDSHYVLSLLPRDLTPAPPERAIAEQEARMRTAAFREEITEKAGGMLDREAVAALLNVSPATVDKQRLRRQIIGVPFGNEYRYPRDQFMNDRPLPGLKTILGAFDRMTPWDQLMMLVTPLDDFADEPRTIFQLLRGNPDKDVLADLRSLAASWAA